MRDLRLNLDDTDFARLVELGRSTIPTLAPAWTDHNVHDPGIMLLELLAWIADAQVFSLSQLRRDERQAYARLLGVRPRGPLPARGLIWPPEGSPGPWPGGRHLARGALVTGDREDVPAFRTTHTVWLSPAELVGLETRPADRSSPRGWLATNRHEEASFRPFSGNSAAEDRLTLTFRGPLMEGAGDEACLSIGIELADSAPPADTGPHSAPGDARRRAPLRVSLSDSAGERSLTIVEDTTLGLTQTGVLLIAAEPRGGPVDDESTVTIRGPADGFLMAPRIKRIGLNVLPIVQLERAHAEEADFGTGLPDQEYRLERPGLVFGVDGADVKVRIGWEAGFEDWAKVDDLKARSPSDRAFTLDEARSLILFGNKVNGFAPPARSALQVDYEVSAGVRGNVPKGRRWVVQGIAGDIWVNVAATGGGAEGLSLEALRSTARHRYRHVRPIVTSDDLVSAARSFTDLGVSRALEITAAVAARRVRGARVLVAVGSGDGGRESPAWYAEVRARLASRLPLGQSLVLLEPRYVDIRVKANLVARPRSNPAAVRDAAEEALRARFRTVAHSPGESEWPFGREVTPLAVQGWLRLVEGVARVTSVSLSAGGRDTGDAPIPLGRTGLPRLELGPDDIKVGRSEEGSRR